MMTKINIKIYRIYTKLFTYKIATSCKILYNVLCKVAYMMETSDL